MTYQDRNQYLQEQDIPSEVSVLKETKKLPLTLPSVVRKPRSCLKEDSRSKIDSWESETSQTLETSDSVSNNTSILVWSMTHLPVSSEWTFTSSLKDPEAESVWEEDAKPESEPNTESPKKRPWSGSRENTTVPFTTEWWSLSYLNYHQSISFQNHQKSIQLRLPMQLYWAFAFGNTLVSLIIVIIFLEVNHFRVLLSICPCSNSELAMFQVLSLHNINEVFFAVLN